ncbi:hypothetical protein HMPREF0663_11011 [Hoylesella oralis ATCC 33269]|uniref:Uncharacterized protein n=1 Tax=Hoylesella oralis ATCC 33269 TaxID=873533 RepID=E7RPB0_9BACT|nr:hypothetical protein HMPREF0663_11011 [Hoylesella oralis ATCC 33269]
MYLQHLYFMCSADVKSYPKILVLYRNNVVILQRKYGALIEGRK